MPLLSFLRRDPAPVAVQPTAPADPQWRRDKRGNFHRLMWLRTKDAGLAGMGGVFVIWHRGVRPEWVFVGGADDLATAIDAARDEPEISRYEMNGGLYVAWAPIVPKFRDGVVAYLHDLCDPVASADIPGVTVNTDAKPVPVLPPK